jgi:hypothetical protein
MLQCGKVAGKQCFFQWHDKFFFGICKDDCILVNKRKFDWESPTQSKQRENVLYINQLKEGDNQSDT